MAGKKRPTVRPITDEATRDRALEVLEAVYQKEKGWIPDREKLLPREDLTDTEVTWFLAELDDRALGVTRVLYRLPIELYQKYAFDLVDPSIDVEAFLSNNKIAEVGRFAVVPEFRDQILIAATLMRAATKETVERGFTHFITDVFEGDPTTPYHFHQRILGFEVVATHEIGELAHKGRRVTMLLDLKAAYQRMSQKRRWIFRYITEGWGERLLGHLKTV
ncbi:MAG: GNAT family N-acetyltransferase [Acidobacteriota bacterium]